MKILAVNAGSSSLKFQLFEMPEEKTVVSGIVERIGYDNAAVIFIVLGDLFFLEHILVGLYAKCRLFRFGNEEELLSSGVWGGGASKDGEDYRCGKANEEDR